MKDATLIMLSLTGAAVLAGGVYYINSIKDQQTTTLLEMQKKIKPNKVAEIITAIGTIPTGIVDAASFGIKDILGSAGQMLGLKKDTNAFAENDSLLGDYTLYGSETGTSYEF